MKNFINSNSVTKIGKVIKSIDQNFQFEEFVKDSNKDLDSLELKKRVHHIINILNEYLPNDFIKVSEILEKVPEKWPINPHKKSEFYFEAWPLIDYIPKYGLNHPNISIPLLAKLTHLFTAEFAIRPFIQNNFELTSGYMKDWCINDSEHIRRLVSEGLRPRLPWGSNLNEFIKVPTPIIPFLEKLKNDNSRFVTKSVANNLNDISKDHPTLVLNLLKDWNKEPSKEIKWITRHALRTLIKKGNKLALEIVGYEPVVGILLSNMKLKSKTITEGNILELDFILESEHNDDQRIMIDYKIYYLLSNGSYSEKVYKFKKLILDSFDKRNFTLKHSFKKITTKKFYLGIHFVEIIINGKPNGKLQFIFSEK